MDAFGWQVPTQAMSCRQGQWAHMNHITFPRSQALICMGSFTPILESITVSLSIVFRWDKEGKTITEFPCEDLILDVLNQI
jgi:hypothetical protein